ncbi:5'/3'-nucleotidase SurE [Pelomonas sp. KK5]|uniref:5'/3'-nucleotidase SurE n=1 Tax=Pelomonas sp. KK5 TaxID=1855730 RepID=UPI00097BDCFF|nr:5'/3'-nucleotidase SurE [Pelomonas sp. KK5]
MTHRVHLCLGLAALALAGPSHALNIVLSNDDGCAAPGITAVRTALLAAGHRVITVGPASNQSGSGAAYAVPDRSTKLVIQPLTGATDVYCVYRVKPAFVAGTALDSTNANYIGSGSPVDATAMGLKVLAKEAGMTPDLVVSGANYGQNLSDSIPHSGTVMNALYAARQGVPAIAISVGVNFAEAATGFPSTSASFPKAADFLVRLLAKLDTQRKAGEPLLTATQPLNLNYPALPGTQMPLGVKLTAPGVTDSFGTAYSRNADGSVAINVGPVPAEPAELAKFAETPAFVANYVTISPITVDFRPTPLQRGLFNRARKDLAALAP